MKNYKPQVDQQEVSDKLHNGRKYPPVCEVTVVDENANAGLCKKIAMSNPDGDSKRRGENNPQGGGL
jgi:hypothetical protein